MSPLPLTEYKAPGRNPIIPVALIALCIWTAFGPTRDSVCQDISKGVTSTNGASESSTGIEKWFQLYAEEASSYKLRVFGESDSELKLVALPALSYTNPLRGAQQHGAFFVWTFDGQPKALGSIWSSVRPDDPGHRHVSHEFQSLSENPIRSSHAAQVGHRGTVPDWNSPADAVEFRLLSDAPSPATETRSRLIQMRRLANSFQAISLETNDEDQRRLRLLNQPVFRYESPSAKVIDGALFAFVMGTDPEAILVLEAVKQEIGTHWRYAIARFTHQPLEVRRGRETVWTCESAQPYVGDRPYFIYWRVSRKPAEL